MVKTAFVLGLILGVILVLAYQRFAPPIKASIYDYFKRMFT